MDQTKNFAKGTIDGTLEQGVTSLSLLTGHGAKFPAPPFNVTVWNATDFPDSADYPNHEIIRVTATSGDDFTTIIRAQEGTSDEDHAEGGKTYQVSLGPTKKTIEDLIALLGDVFGSGTAILVSVDGETIELRQSATKGISVTGGSTAIEDTTSVDIGDPIGNNNSSFVSISDQNQRFSLIGMDIATDRTTSATVAVGTLAAKLAIRDGSGAIIGYIPIYGSIT